MNKRYKIETKQTGRIYAPEVLSNAIEKYIKEQVLPGRAIGEIEGKESFVLLDHTSHLIKSIEKVSDEYEIDFQILKNPFGELLKTLIDQDMIYFGIRGLGNVNKNTGHVDDLHIISIDAIKYCK